uniref:Uncharacterized protein n=1 Tax=Brassica oleracea var. oleracea TaxID=109376 RepID=A0A0D3BEE6_BRAOL
MVVHAYHSNIIQDFLCVYLRSMTQYVRLDCGMADGKEEPTIMFEDEAYSAPDLHHPRIAENWRGPRDLQYCPNQGEECFNEATLKHITSSKWLWHSRRSVMNQIVDDS